jgi:hypothetical protein
LLEPFNATAMPATRLATLVKAIVVAPALVAEAPVA